MADVTFQAAGASTSVVVTPIPGSIQEGGDHDDRGGTDYENVRAGISRSGQLQCLVEDSGDQTYASITGLRSGVGAATMGVSGSDIETAAECLVDVTIEGEDVQIATISWMGTTA